ncbi:MAG: AraC family transcriptional regulator [Ruminococcaceae bacterium]|nr:AraC family transcriptional regulator [Oscillospiraceae bacterium]
MANNINGNVRCVGYGFDDEWKDIKIDKYMGYTPRMTDYHMHNYYEMSIIISGNVNVLLTNSIEHSSQSKIVLLRPYTPHYIFCEADMLYNRININFTLEYMEEISQIEELLQVFGPYGSVLKINEEQCKTYTEIAEKINNEDNQFRRRLLLLYLISILSDNMKQSGDFSKMPTFMNECLAFISSNYNKKIVASDLSEKFGVGRTTIMTAFKKYTGVTLNEYINRCRLKNAVILMKEGQIEQTVAEKCGFNDSCNMIRCFKREVGCTPKKYIEKIRNDFK